jgi:hypothetical protein
VADPCDTVRHGYSPQDDCCVVSSAYGPARR